jgi:hypothetical protein
MYLNTADAHLIQQTREAMKMVRESQSPTASLFERSRLARRMDWLRKKLEACASRKLLGAL